jgi:hypothetical protein
MLVQGTNGKGSILCHNKQCGGSRGSSCGHDYREKILSMIRPSQVMFHFVFILYPSNRLFAASTFTPSLFVDVQDEDTANHHLLVGHETAACTR